MPKVGEKPVVPTTLSNRNEPVANVMSSKWHLASIALMTYGTYQFEQQGRDCFSHGRHTGVSTCIMYSLSQPHVFIPLLSAVVSLSIAIVKYCVCTEKPQHAGS